MCKVFKFALRSKLKLKIYPKSIADIGVSKSYLIKILEVIRDEPGWVAIHN
jgi:hypothetical protein